MASTCGRVRFPLGTDVVGALVVAVGRPPATDHFGLKVAPAFLEKVVMATRVLQRGATFLGGGFVARVGASGRAGDVGASGWASGTNIH